MREVPGEHVRWLPATALVADLVTGTASASQAVTPMRSHMSILLRQTAGMHTIRVWDLPTRLFHWALAACVVGLVITANIGGNWMNWHFRFGYSVLTLLLFRFVWGVVGGHWSRFSSFLYRARYAAGLCARAWPRRRQRGPHTHRSPVGLCLAAGVAGRR